MAQDQGKVRFIRVNGRVVPIRDKGPSQKQAQRNYQRLGDGARQGQYIDNRFESKAQRGAYKAGGFGAAAGALGGAVIGARGAKLGSAIKRFASGGLFGAATGFVVAHTIKYNANKIGMRKEKERAHVRMTGHTSDGMKPSRNKSGV